MTEFQKQIRESYRNRISELSVESEHQDIVILKSSISDFWDFIKLHPMLDECVLALNQNGRLRSVWDDNIDHFALLFHGDRTVSYIVIRCDETENKPENKRIYEGERVRLVDLPDIYKRHKLQHLIFRNTH